MARRTNGGAGAGMNGRIQPPADDDIEAPAWSLYTTAEAKGWNRQTDFGEGSSLKLDVYDSRNGRTNTLPAEDD